MHKWISVLLMFFPAIVVADSPAVRPLDHSAAATLAHALERSALVRSLVTELDTTTAIVHVAVSRALPSGVAGATHFVASRSGYTYIRVTVLAALRPDLRAIILGHELQHALDIARSGTTSDADLQRLLETTGYRTGTNLFETPSALRTERRVRAELKRGTPE